MKKFFLSRLFHGSRLSVKILFLLLLGLTACGEKRVNYGPYSIGIDESWYPLQVGIEAENLTAFSTALVQEVAKIEQIPLQLLNINWTQLFELLDKGEVGGVLTSLEPDLITRNKYVFSNPFVRLGVVLIVPENSNAKNLIDLKDKIVGVYQFDNSVLLAQQYPSVVIKLYQNKPSILEELAQGKIDGVLMPILDAQALVAHIDAHQIKIVTPPLDDKGLRLVTLKDKNSFLVKYFNRALKKMEASGKYVTLRHVYQL